MRANSWLRRVDPVFCMAAFLALLGIALGQHVSGTPGVAAVVAFGVSFVLGKRWANRWADMSPTGYFCAAMGIALLPFFLGRGWGEAARWIPVASGFDLRAGLWANLCFLAGHARLAALPVGARQGAMTITRDGAALTLFAAFVAMPDGFSLVTFALMCAWILVTAPSPVAGRWGLALGTFSVPVALVALLVLGDFRLARVRAWLGATWRTAPDIDGRGWAAHETLQAFLHADWLGAHVAAALPARHADWYGLAQVAMYFGLATLGVVVVATCLLAVLFLVRGWRRPSPPERVFWGGAALLFAWNTLIAVLPAVGLAPYVGHYGLPLLSAADSGCLAMLLVGHLGGTRHVRITA